jgi:hypothetical protein
MRKYVIAALLIVLAGPVGAQLLTQKLNKAWDVCVRRGVDSTMRGRGIKWKEGYEDCALIEKLRTAAVAKASRDARPDIPDPPVQDDDAALIDDALGEQ